MALKGRGKIRKKRRDPAKKLLARAAKPLVLKEDLRIKKTKIKVVGIGDGGSQIVANLAKTLKGIDFAIVNTDWRKKLRLPSRVKTFYFGEKQTRGLGTGGDKELAKTIAVFEKEKIKQLLKGADLCFLVSCLGGGTGSGAAPVFAKIAQAQRILCVGVFTTPFKFEGIKRAEIAKESIEMMKPNLNALLVFPNEKIFQVAEKNLSFNEGFEAMNKVLAQGLEGLISLIFRPGLINIDFADLKTCLEGKGRQAFLINAEFKKGIKTEEVKKRIFQNPFLSCNFRQANKIIFNIISDSLLSLHEVSDISKIIFEAVSPEAKIIFGVSFDAKLVGKIRVVLLAIGAKERKSAQRFKKKNSLKKKEENKSKEGQNTRTEVKIRRNALQVREEAKIQEQEIIAKEKLWETPAILRKGLL